MTPKQEAALRQALEALELALSSHGVMLLSDPPQDPWKTRGVEGKSREAITALRRALEQQTQDWSMLEAAPANLELQQAWDNLPDSIKAHPGVKALYQAKQPAYRAVKTVHEGKPYYVSEPEQQPAEEPACWDGDDKCPNRQACCDAEECLYTRAQPAAQWVGLTAQHQREGMAQPHCGSVGVQEAKLRELNEHKEKNA